ncbi:phage tail tape measure C-terminal domain-containing protein [Pseudodonghicola sp.]|uniref:phage tail tape measure C-terminal domain-containing protein n=1 Tax=Pseudodonghicola sp. TaxID=1969463 RepID=UPI003A97E33D
MAETHELRLKIDAGAAQSGARTFKAAVETVRAAVRDLDRDTTGAFTKLRTIKPQVDVTPLTRARTEANALATATTAAGTASDRAAERIRKLAVQSANSLRISTDQASRLRDRLLSVGDTAGIAKIEAALDRLRGKLINATSSLDVQEARAEYNTLASELNRTAREAERLNAIANAEARAQEEASRAAADHAAQMDRLRARYNPLYAASKQYEVSLEEIAQAEKAGVITSQLAANARAEAANKLVAASAANEKATTSMFAMQKGAGRMLGLQVNQMAQVAGMATSAEQALKGIAFQAADVGLVFGGMGIAIGAVAGVALPLLIDRLFAVIPETKTFADALDELESSIDAARAAASKTRDYTALRDEYGLVTASVRDLVDVQKELARLDAADTLRSMRDAMASDAGVGWMDALAGYARRLRDELSLTKTEAAGLEALFRESQMTTDAGRIADIYATIRERIVSAAGGVENLTSEQSAMVRKLVEGEDAARHLAAVDYSGPIAAATGQTNAWASAMAGVNSEIQAIMSSLASVGGSMISNAAKSAELTALQAGKTVRESAVARERYRKEAEWSAREQAAGGGVGGWMQRQLIDAERYQFNESVRLDSELEAARTAARKAASSGGGSKRVETLGDESRQLERLIKQMNNRVFSLNQENEALALVVSGQADTMETAQFMAAAMTANGGALDETTAAMVRQYEAAQKLNDKLTTLANDPVKKWMDSVPNWIEAGQQIEMGAINSLSDAISEMIKTGKFDIEALGEAILGTIADIVADQAVAELANLMGRGEGNGLGGLLGDLLGGDAAAPTGDGAAVAQGGVQAGASISQAMIQAGSAVSQQISAAMMQAGTQAGQQTRMGHVQGGQQAANATRLAGMQHAQQVRTATTTSGQQHATKVRTAITSAGSQHAGMIRQAQSGGGGGIPGGGGGGGILDMFGGWQGILGMAVGAFDVGGVSTAPANYANAPLRVFQNAPHYAQGTTNTSGIPAVLHPNEAVIPLSKGRKIPVELGGSAAGDGGTVINMPQTFNVTATDADSFRRSRDQIAADMASAGQKAARKNR